MGTVRHQECQRALTQKRTLGGRFEVVAYLSSEIFVSLRTAASAEAPWSPMLLKASLWTKGGAGMVREQECQRALTQKQTLGRWFECPSSLLERLQGRIALEALGERRGALVSDAVASEPVNERWSGDGERSGVSRGADTKANTMGRRRT